MIPNLCHSPIRHATTMSTPLKVASGIKRASGAATSTMSSSVTESPSPPPASAHPSEHWSPCARSLPSPRSRRRAD